MQGNVSKLRADTTYGATLIRAKLAPHAPDGGLSDAEPRPEVILSPTDQAQGWELLRDERYTGVDAHRFYFTLRAPKDKLPPPTVDVRWENVEVARVLGVKNGFEKINGGVRFTLSSNLPPTGSFTEKALGAVRLGVFHNWYVRKSGPYRDEVYPENQIKAQLNYMMATVEVCRAFGWIDTDKPDFIDHINVYGFETHYPNGHRDYPPHFHIMLAWDGWKAAQVGHYLLDAEGKIIKNNFWSLHEDIETIYQREETTPYFDKSDALIFETTILPDGSGLVITRSATKQSYLICQGDKDAMTSVVVKKRNGDEWETICEVTANDDVEHGLFKSVATYVDSSERIVEFQYDPDLTEVK
ncbi:MAG: hypothetical protein Q4G03_05800 [Planctomycetia bacterium]|nr:hypothetical protein [Planctomycetia bacterium]